jgi:hypothetical protein
MAGVANAAHRPHSRYNFHPWRCPLLCGRENGVMGSLEARRVAEGDWTSFGKPSSSIYFLVAPHGGIRPALRRRSRLALTLSEREVISRGVTASCRRIASRISGVSDAAFTCRRRLRESWAHNRRPSGPTRRR